MLKTKIAGLDKLIRKKAMDIGVAFHTISGDKGYEQQARLPLDKTIINFDQLKSRFAGSEWAVFFELKNKHKLKDARG